MATQRKYEPPKCGYTIEGAHIRTDGTIKNKVSGTSMAPILGISPFSSPFRTACALLGLTREDISGKAPVVTGQVLEERLIEFANERYHQYGTFIPAEKIYGAREGDHDDWASDFDDEIFAGHVDGIVQNDDGLMSILEVKTSGNWESWANGVPEYYWWQVALYNLFITQSYEAYVILGMVDSETHKDPLAWELTDENVNVFRIEMDADKAIEGVEKVKEWYQTYIMNGVTPDYDPTDPRDIEVYDYLLNLTSDEETIQDLIDQRAELRQEIDRVERQIIPLKDREEMLNNRIKQYMTVHNKTTLDGAGGRYFAVITTTTRRNVDALKLSKAGIDPEPYMTEKVTKSFTIKEKKVQ